MTHTTLSRLFVSGSSAALIAGLATETIVVSTRIMKNPMTSAHRAGHGLRSRASLRRVGAAAPACVPVAVRELVEESVMS